MRFRSRHRNVKKETMSYTDADRTLALAGVFQGAKLTAKLARGGVADADTLAASTASIFRLTPDSVEAVFGSVAGVASGLRCLITQLDVPKDRDVDISRYAVGVIQLAVRLSRDSDAQEALGRDIGDLNDRQQAFNMDDSQLYAPLADIYQRHLSNQSPRIMVKGEPLHLQNPDTAARIRTALLAGVRAAHLWLQCGGSRWQLVFRRRRTVDTARHLLQASD